MPTLLKTTHKNSKLNVHVLNQLVRPLPLCQLFLLSQLSKINSLLLLQAGLADIQTENERLFHKAKVLLASTSLRKAHCTSPTCTGI